MRISRRTSGGRGEYEISEAAPSGISPRDLAGRRLVLGFSRDVAVNTGTTLRIQGGKPRLRLLPGADIQLHLQLAAALLMPHSVREDVALGSGAPVMQRNRYAIERIELRDARLVGADEARLRVDSVVLMNRTYPAEEFIAAERLLQVRRAWDRASDFPAPIPDLLARHRQAVQGGGPIMEETERLVYELQAAVAEESEDLGVLYSANTDVLPALIQFLDSIEAEPPLVKPDEIEAEQVEIRRRVVKQWRDHVAYRGAASARFRREVREAYDSTCIFCGRRFPKTDFSSAGVDAAHILPWAGFDVDHISNGICACKFHHWAFDENLIRIVYREGRYFVEMPEEIAAGLKGAGAALAAIQENLGEIPSERLPRVRAKRPNPAFLARLAETVE